MDNPKLLKHFENIGLTDKQSLVYASLLEKGGGFPAQIAKYTGLNRSTVYVILGELKNQKIISEIEKNKKLFYQVDKPEQLLIYTKNQVRLANDRHDSAERLMPRILDFFGGNEERAKISYIGGNNVYEQIFDLIQNDKVNHLSIYWNPQKLEDKNISLSTLLNFCHIREKLNIHSKELIPENEYNRNYSDKTFIQAKKGYAPKIHFIENDNLFCSSIFVLENNKIILTKDTSSNFSGIIIDDQKITQLLSSLFDSLWDSSKS